MQRGEIALVRRGGCTFRAKVLGAQRAGAAAVIVSDPDPVRGSLERSVRIPAIAVGDRGAGLTGKRVRVRVHAQTTTVRAPNVIAESGATGAPRVVMAGGHLDSVPAGPGLNDNGSGVAAVLEMAEELGGRPLPEGTALRFGFWGAEEIGLVGSTYYVDQLSRAERRRIAAYVNLDMVGSPGATPSVYTGNERIATALRRTLGADAPNTTLGGSSDHAPFDEAGIPTGGIFTGLDNCYHQRCDTVENVDRTLATTSSRAAGAALVELLRPSAEHASRGARVGHAVHGQLLLGLEPRDRVERGAVVAAGDGLRREVAVRDETFLRDPRVQRGCSTGDGAGDDDGAGGGAEPVKAGEARRARPEDERVVEVHRYASTVALDRVRIPLGVAPTRVRDVPEAP